jgi:hypothetical protein
MGPLQALRASWHEAKRPLTPEQRERLRRSTEGRSELGFLSFLIRRAPIDTPPARDERTDTRR